MQANFSEKNQIRAYNLQCYMFIHPPGVDSLSSLPSLFLTSEPLCGRSPTESEEKYLSDNTVSLQANIFIYYLPTIFKLQHLPPPSYAAHRQTSGRLPKTFLVGRMLKL